MDIVTYDIFGQSSSDSSRSVALQRSLESKLHQRLDAHGSPEYGLIWKRWDMESGPPICALRGSARRTSGSASGGWQTSTSETQRKSRRAMMRSVDNGRRSGGGQSSSPGLEQEAEIAAGILPPELEGPEMEDTRRTLGIEAAGWRSPNLGSGITLDRLVDREGNPWTPGQRAYDKDTGRLCEVGLDQEVQLSGWLSPQADDSRGVGGAGSRDTHQSMLHHQAQAAGWPTPRTITGGPESARRKQELGRTESGGGDLQATALQAGTDRQCGTRASTAGSGEYRLNPFFAGWMMGYPRAWTFAGLRAVTRLLRKSRAGSRSSRDTATQ